MNVLHWWIAPVMALVISASVSAADAGRISGVDGPVTIVRGADKLNAKVGTVLQPGDVVVTGDTGRVRWNTMDEGVMTLSHSSRLAIDSYSFREGEGSSHYNLKGGGVSVVSGSIQAPGYKLSTPVADITVNGTQYKSIFCKGNCPGFADGMYVVVTEGRVTVSNGAGSLVGTAGQSIFVAGPDVAPALVDGAPRIVAAFDFDFDVDFEGDFGDVIERQLSPS